MQVRLVECVLEVVRSQPVEHVRHVRDLGQRGLFLRPHLLQICDLHDGRDPGRGPCLAGLLLDRAAQQLLHLARLAHLPGLRVPRLRLRLLPHLRAETRPLHRRQLGRLLSRPALVRRLRLQTELQRGLLDLLGAARDHLWLSHVLRVRPRAHPLHRNARLIPRHIRHRTHQRRLLEPVHHHGTHRKRGRRQRQSHVLRVYGWECGVVRARNTLLV